MQRAWYSLLSPSSTSQVCRSTPGTNPTRSDYNAVLSIFENIVRERWDPFRHRRALREAETRAISENRVHRRRLGGIEACNSAR